MQKSKRITISLFALILVFLCAPCTLRANDSSVKRYSFSGTVTQINGDGTWVGASVGAPITGTFGYNTSIPWNPYYDGNPTMKATQQTDLSLFTLKVNGVDVTAKVIGINPGWGSDQVLIWNNLQGVDRIWFEVNTLVANTYQAILSIDLKDTTGSVFSVADYPSTLNRGSFNNVSCFFQRRDMYSNIYFSITNISPMDAPAQPPVADAGSVQAVASGDWVHLDGSNSAPASSIVSYQWMQLSGPTVVLSGPNIVRPTFYAPSVTADGASLEFQLTVTDSIGRSSQDTCTITVTLANDYDWLTYNGHEYALTGNWEPWVIAEQEAVNAGGHLATVNDAAENSWLASTFKDTGSIDRAGGTPGHGAAYIGYYYNGAAWGWISGEPVTYTNLASWFPNGGTHGYLLTLGYSPEGIWDAAWWVSEPWRDGVFDPWGLPPQALKGIIERPITVVNQPPVANAGVQQSPRAGDPVVLDGSHSFDPENGALSYLWEQVFGPQVELSNPALVNPTFTAPNVSPDGATLSFKLTVTDVGGLTATDTCMVNVLWLNEPPVADAGGNQTVNSGAQVTLNGSNSTDPDDGIASYRWTQLSGTPSVVLNDTTAVKPTFTAPNVPPHTGATLTFELTVTDRGGLQSIAQCTVTVQWVNTPPTADAGENVQILSRDQITTVVNGNAGDADGDSLVYTWLEGEATLFSGQPAPDGTTPIHLGVIPPLSIGAHTFTLLVSDGTDSVRDDMILTAENSAPATAPSGAGTYQLNTPVTLSGEVADYDGNLVTYTWLEGDTKLGYGTIQTPIGGDPVKLPPYVISNLSLGVHTVTLRVNDGINAPVNASITVTIEDTSAPTLAPVADKTILWPPNHQMVPVIIAAYASDNSGLPVSLKVAIACNEASGGTAYWTEPVINQAAGSIAMQFMAERSGKGDGRQYTVTITATDEVGNESTANVMILVPHDQGKK